MNAWLVRYLARETGRSYHDVGFAFEAVADPATGAALLILAGAIAFILVRTTLSGAPTLRRTGLGVLRGLIVALLLALALGPILIGRRIDPASSVALLLFDDSASMAIADTRQGSPAERLRSAYLARDGRFEHRLTTTHTLRPFSFGERVRPIKDLDALSFDQIDSDIVGGLRAAHATSGREPVAAIVLFSDGTQHTPLDEKALDGVPPVYTVGVGAQAVSSLALESIAVSRTHFDRSPIALTTRVSATGLAGRQATIDVFEGDRLVEETAFTIAEENHRSTQRIEFIPARTGFTTYRTRVRLADTDSVTARVEDPIAEDNHRHFLLDNRKKTYRILYFTGRPNWQHAFVRRALDQDPQLELASLVRISGPDRKFKFRGMRTTMANPLFEGFDDEAGLAPRYDEAVFLRLGVRESELDDGYPSTAVELFDFDLVIWGDVERNFFADDHLELTRRFVSERGGSLLLLGGPRGLSEGGYRATVIEGMLPVTLGVANTERATEFRFRPTPTVDGTLSGIFSLDPDPATNQTIWSGLPELFGLNPTIGTRAGATVLAHARGTGANQQPLYAWQPFGKGRTAILAVGETWQWRMLRASDDYHEQFWRQLARSLVQSAPEPISVTARNELLVGRPDTIRIVVRDSLYEKRDGVSLRIEAHGPGGEVHTLPVEESMLQTGSYAAAVQFERAGRYDLAIVATDREGEIGRADAAHYVHPDHRERISAGYDPSFLQDIARLTDGRFYELADLDRLVDELPPGPSEEEHFDRVSIWHVPQVYGLLILLLSLEWFLRRRKGHP